MSARSFPSPWRALAAAALSALLPGAGQLLLRAWLRGTLLLASSACLAGLAWLAWRYERATVLVFLLRPSFLLVALCLHVTLALIRWLIVADAFRLARQRCHQSLKPWGVRTQLTLLACLSVLFALAALPHLVIAFYTYQAHHLLVRVFASEASAGPQTWSFHRPASRVSGSAPPRNAPFHSPPVPAVGETTAVAQLPSMDEVHNSFPGQQRTESAPDQMPSVPTPEATSTTQPPTPDNAEHALADRRIAILLLGSDAGPGRDGTRTDAIILAVLDIDTQRAGLFGVPRNLVGVPLPAELHRDFPDGRWPQLINALYRYASRDPGRFPGATDPGAAALKATIGELTGVPVDYYVMVDMAGFVRVIDALGGVTIDVPKPVATWLSPPRAGEDWAYYEIPAGRQHLNGHQALAYVRSRTGTSDYDRMARQRCLLGALRRQADLPTLLVAFPALVEAIKDAVRTDIPIEALPQLAELAFTVSPEHVVAVGFTPPTFTSGWTADRYPIPDIPRIQHAVAAALSPEGLPPDLAPPRPTLPSACSWQE